MLFLLTILISTVTTFCWILVTYDYWIKRKAKVKGYHMHHSVYGLTLTGIGLIIPFMGGTVSAVGIGVFLSHGFEEIYYNHTKLSKAFFVFFTKDN